MTAEPTRYTDPSRWATLAQGLSQYRRIKPGAVERWADHLSQLPEAEAAFHAQRVGGFGGSEIGVLLTEAHGGRDPWSTANWIVRQKLLDLLPLPPEPQMLRGKLLEPLAQACFLKPRDIRIDRDTMKAITRPIESGKYAWMEGNADLAVIQKGRRYLLEFKNPAELPGESDEMDFRYAAQGLFYAAKAERNGIKVDGVLLVHFKIHGQDALVDWMHDPEVSELLTRKVTTSLKRGQEPLIQFSVQEIPRDVELIKRIWDVGSHYWNDFVLKGLVPGLPKKPEYKISPEQFLEGQKAADAYLRWREIEKIIEMRTGESARVLKGLYDLDPQAPVPFGIKIQQRRTMDAERAAAFLKAKGHQDLAFCEETWDALAMTKALSYLGADVEPYRSAGKFDSAKARALLTKEEEELLTKANPVVAVYGRSADSRVVKAIGDANNFATTAVESISEAMREQLQQLQNVEQVPPELMGNAREGPRGRRRK